MGKKINELVAMTDAESDDNDRQSPSADPITGVAKYETKEQLKNTFMLKRVKHIGTSGSTITIGALANKDIVFILRETGPIFEVVSSPDPAEFSWDLTTITLGAPQGTGERFLIGYQNFI